MAASIDLVGKTFNQLTVIGLADQVAKSGAKFWLCACSCGGTNTVRTDSLKNSSVKSCGCATLTALENRATHRLSGTPEYATWVTMKARCHNPKAPKYYLYGARGIFVCDAWRDSFETFFADMGVRPSAKHSIERKDGSQGYSKSNCVWADKETQANNTCLNRPITYNGETLNLNQWSRKLGIPAPTLINRLGHRKLSVEEAFTLKPFQRKP